ncbi:4-hydroxy-2-oxoheptanedioate aldolase [Kribbella orskensis]|uniref:4-hydroxy-2-oxoheptanedioate aldolase n=1 Tax=Kribbella orskensis TaxID=2512216 RepID=A0ABY2BV98_9ACTN|nr:MULTISPECIES: aldolase/citrate lyase family protein [Kribbella]TCN44131.1 4-hydroxy-2-oxoheptanedioate aldolase [Kribbella sp. VKM Ac-2500]TCO32091.1 4-hydroxy-2-oxoheptanedioate aldolase [Kribbella orskensis]
MSSQDFADRLRARRPAVGYWVILDAPAATERIAGVGYDYVVLDAQHGLLSTRGILDGLIAIDAADGATVGMVRVEANNATPIGRALDAGAAGVIVPLIDTAEDAAQAVRAARYPPSGIRSYGPTRSGLRIGPTPAEANAATVVLAMIETRAGLDNVAEICATPGLDGIYVGPSDLCLAVGGKFPGDPDVAERFDEAIALIARVAADAGVAAGIHTQSGEMARQRLAEGYTYATVSSDLDHLRGVAAAHLATVRE